MHRIDSASKEVDKFGGGKHGFTEGAPGVTAPTETTDDWLDGVQEEICNAIEGFGDTLVKGTRNQLHTALSNPAATGSTDVIHATAVDGHGIVAESDTSSPPAKSALRIVPQDADPVTAPEEGDVYSNSADNGIVIYDGAQWKRTVGQIYAMLSSSDNKSGAFSNFIFESGAADILHTIPANSTRIGSTFRVRAGGVFTSDGGVTFADVSVALDGSSVGEIRINAVSSATHFWGIDTIVTVRAMSGADNIIYSSSGGFSLSSGSDIGVPDFSCVQRSIDMTSSRDFSVTCTINGGTAGDSMDLLLFTIDQA